MGKKENFLVFNPKGINFQQWSGAPATIIKEPPGTGG
jgi:hypothetical protein